MNVRILPGFSCRDCVAVLINCNDGEVERRFLFALWFQESSSIVEIWGTRELFWRRKVYLIIRYHSSSHHLVWGSASCNDRRMALLEFLNSSYLEILNHSNDADSSARRLWLILPWDSMGSYKIFKAGRFLLNSPCQITGIFCSL